MAAPGGSPSKSVGSSESAGSKRRVSAAQAGKVAVALEKMRAEEQERAMQKDLDVIVSTIKGKHELILATKAAFVMAGCTVESSTKGNFPRGVRTIGDQNRKIPQRDAIRLLASALKVPPSIVSNIDDLKVNAHRLLCLGLGVGMKFALPSQSKDEVTLWMEERYAAQGRPLTHFALDADELKWHTGEIGHFYLVKGTDGSASGVGRRRTGETKALTIKAPIEEWAFENWHERSCFLQREGVGMVTKCMMTALFSLDDDEAPWPAPPLPADGGENKESEGVATDAAEGPGDQKVAKRPKTAKAVAASSAAAEPTVVPASEVPEGEEEAHDEDDLPEGDGAQS